MDDRSTYKLTLIVMQIDYLVKCRLEEILHTSTHCICYVAQNNCAKLYNLEILIILKT
jgi:hypothetical protein